jgi:prophage regulatory protein
LLLELNLCRADADKARRAEIMSEQIRVVGAILRRKQVEQAVGLSRSTIYQRMKDGTFPHPVALGERVVGWRVADIELFLEDPAGYRAPYGTPRGEHRDD